MPWLRIDDGFAAHPKVTMLTHRERWVWIAVMCYCARYRTDGFLPQNLSENVPGLGPSLLKKCVEIGLVDEVDHELRIHDWEHYAPKDPTKAERQAKWRRKAKTAPGSNGSTTPPVDEGVDGLVDAVVDSLGTM